MLLKNKSADGLSGHLAPVFTLATIVFLVLLALLLSVALWSYYPDDPAWSHNNGTAVSNNLGVLGAWYSDLSFSLLGKLSYLLPLFLIALAAHAWLEKGFDKEVLSWRVVMLLTAILSGCVLWAKHDLTAINTVSQTGGGALGAWLVIGLEKSIKSMPVIMAFATIIFFTSVSLLFNIPWLSIAEWIGKGISQIFANLLAGFGAAVPKPKAAKNAMTQNSSDDDDHALQDKIKQLNRMASEKKQSRQADKPHFTIDRYEPEDSLDEEPATLTKQSTATPPWQNTTEDHGVDAEPKTAAAIVSASVSHEGKQPNATETPTDAKENRSMKSEPSFFNFANANENSIPVDNVHTDVEPQISSRGIDDKISLAAAFSPDTGTEKTTTETPPKAEDISVNRRVLADDFSTAKHETNNASVRQLSNDGIVATSAVLPPKQQTSAAPAQVSEPSEDLVLSLAEEPTMAEQDISVSPTTPATASSAQPLQMLGLELSKPIKPATPLDINLTESFIVGSEQIAVTSSDSDDQSAKAQSVQPIDFSRTDISAGIDIDNDTTPTPADDLQTANRQNNKPQPVSSVASVHAGRDDENSVAAAVQAAPTHTSIGKAYQPEDIEIAETPYELPSIDLLDNPPPHKNAYTEDMLAEMAGVLEKTLNQFNIKAIVMHVSPGPVITRFELELAPGIQAKKITNLSQDLARALAVSRVRVEEVIPGSSYVGLEVPNKQRQVVYFKDVVRSRAFQDSKSPLTVSLGSDTSGKPVVADLMKMPHALVAGTTGSGKSVCINVMLLSMLYKASPKDLRLIMVDPKMLEMSMYEDIPHLLTPVITDMNEAENALTWAVGEMERRYQLMAALKVRKIDAFNEQVEEAIANGEPIKDPLWEPDENVGYTHHPNLESLPFIVIVIDELADMMMVVGKQVEQLIARLTQKARAAGIHVVLATQRPSTDVLTGLIKANVPTRIAFQVSSGTDSRVIIDGVGAEKLLGHGDMLYVPPGASHPQRLHGAFVGDAETDRITNYLRSTGEPEYISGITVKQDPETLGAFGAAEAAEAAEAKEDADPLYAEAVEIVLQTGKASISSVQRQLRIGYNRAARMIEDMQEQGIVSEPINGVRKVLAAPSSGEGS